MMAEEHAQNATATDEVSEDDRIPVPTAVRNVDPTLNI